ncbi:hypothetical protein [Flavobacterium sp. B17]|uniref:hypothetical protein n=1 Tax=Flavobacterium sp. B17 TaxID=95618 RepID=UPI00034A6E1C|nr:hypothetical protein [Flavobacterium sp. B17]
MKHLFTTAALLFSMTAFAQVGINNTSPKATLDITPKTTDGSKPEGLLIPQLDGNILKTAAYGTPQKGIIVYAKSAASPTDAKTVNITAEGYYYFDGSVWQKMTGAAAGDTTNDAWINDTTNGLVKLGTKADGTARSANTDFVAKDDGSVGIGITTPAEKLDVNGNMILRNSAVSGGTVNLSMRTTGGTNRWGIGMDNTETGSGNTGGDLKIWNYADNGGYISSPLTIKRSSGSVGIGTSLPDASAALDVNSTNKGFLPPRVALNSKTDVSTISSPTAGLLVYNTGTGSLKSAGMYYWDGSQWTSLKGDGGNSSATDLNVGETRTAVITVPTSSFTAGSTGISRTWMNGRAVNNTQSVNYKLLSDAVGSTNGFVNFGPNGALRMDFASGGYWGASAPAPKIVNTSSSAVFYSLNALSTADANVTWGAGMWLAAGAVCYQIDGNDGFSYATNSWSEYVNANILIHNTIDGSVQFYIGTWSLMSANDGLGHNNAYGLFTITRYK